MADHHHLHPIPAETRVVEDMRDLGYRLTNFLTRNRTGVSCAAITAVSLLLHRSILRRELKRIHFEVELIDNDDFGDYGLSVPDLDTGE